MGRRKKGINIVSLSYSIARILNDIFTFFSGNPKRIAKRGVNKFLGRKIVRKIYRK